MGDRLAVGAGDTRFQVQRVRRAWVAWRERVGMCTRLHRAHRHRVSACGEGGEGGEGWGGPAVAGSRAGEETGTAGRWGEDENGSWKLSGGERWLHKCVGRTELTQGPLDPLCGGGSAYRAERRGRAWHLGRSDWALLEQEPWGCRLGLWKAQRTGPGRAAEITEVGLVLSSAYWLSPACPGGPGAL